MNNLAFIQKILYSPNSKETNSAPSGSTGSTIQNTVSTTSNSHTILDFYVGTNQLGIPLVLMDPKTERDDIGILLLTEALEKIPAACAFGIVSGQ